MQINTRINSNIPVIPSFGNKKIPRFLYHLTTEENYQSMLKDGIVEARRSLFDSISGVSMLELSNFFKRWKVLKGFNEEHLGEKLLSQVTQKAAKSKIIALKIPTGSIDKSKLIIRSQNILFSASREEYWDDMAKYLEAPDKAKDYMKHICKGDSSKNSKLYKQRKNAIEYIYPQDIDIAKVEKIGEADINLDDKLPLKEILSKLFKSKLEKLAFEKVFS